MSNLFDTIGVLKELQSKKCECFDCHRPPCLRCEALIDHASIIVQALEIAVDELHKIECCDFMDEDGFRKPTQEAKIARNTLSHIRSLNAVR